MGLWKGLVAFAVVAGSLAFAGFAPLALAGPSPPANPGASLAEFPGATADDAQDPRCPRKAERTFTPGSTTVIKDGRPPCRIEFRDTGIRLEAVADGSRPDPGRTVLVDSNGRYISANAPGWGAVISVWDSRGRFMYSFGREGEGPGELTARGMLSLFIDGRDNLHIRDGGLRWSVFSPEHEFVRSVPAQVMGGVMEELTVILDDGSALASGNYRGDHPHHFRVVDSAGALARTFGPVTTASDVYLERPITHAGGDSFWAAPPIDGEQEYVLEEWGLDGELRRAFRRDVSWYEWRGDEMTSSFVSQLHLTHNGLLYVVIPRATEEFLDKYETPRHMEGLDEEDEERALMELMELMEAVIEVIDTRSGELLASDAFRIPEMMETAAQTLFRGSMRGFRYAVGDDGMPFVEIVDVELVPR